jgi:hypothetical protein
MKNTKEQVDIEEDAKKHLLFIVKCSLEFDEGERDSMFHVTTSLRAFFKDNKRSGTKSILKHFQLLGKEFIDIAGIGKPVSLGPMFAGKLALPDYLPDLSIKNRKWLSFLNWYDGLVLHAPNSYSFSRKDVIAKLGEQYVQHVDKNVTKNFHWLYKNIDNYIGWNLYSGGILIKQPNIVYSVLRMICHEVIVSLQKHKKSLINYNSFYFSKLKEIKPYLPFGKYKVSLIEQSTVSVEFFCTKEGKLFKLPITGDYSLYNHKENAPDTGKYIINVIEKIIQKKVYDILDGNVKYGISNFNIGEMIELEPETFAAVHKPTLKYQEAEKILIKFSFKLLIEII